MAQATQYGYGDSQTWGPCVDPRDPRFVEPEDDGECHECSDGSCGECVDAFIAAFAGEYDEPAGKWLMNKCGESFGDFDGDETINEFLRDSASFYTRGQMLMDKTNFMRVMRRLSVIAQGAA